MKKTFTDDLKRTDHLFQNCRAKKGSIALTQVAYFAMCFYLISSLACSDQLEVNTPPLQIDNPANQVINVPSECRTRVACQGSLALYCVGQSNEVAIDCAERGGQCISDRGCTLCEPNLTRCAGLEKYMCSADGLSESLVETCEAECYLGECTDPCARAVSERSYQGCEYWPSPISNLVSTEFTFAIGVVNVNEISVNISISRGNEVIIQRMISPGALEVIELPWIDDLSYLGTIDQNGVQGSARVSQGAYQVNTDLPVTVYQFNPLEYRLDRNCTFDDDDPTDNACFSYSNDASLLLPTHALNQDYIVLSYPSLALSVDNAVFTNPSTFQVVAVTPGSTNVDIDFKSATGASHNGSLQAYQAGDRASFSLNRGDVLQFVGAPVNQCRNSTPIDNRHGYCETGAESDLSGTRISSDKPIEVFGSHTCAFVPYNVFACDHLEESIFPLATWGRNAVVTALQALIDEPSLIRVTSGADQNRIEFKPVSTHPSVTLNQGESVEFYTQAGFVVKGQKSLQVTQFLVGQNYSENSTRDGFGDPAMSLIPPSDQFRKDYTILAQETYALHYINLAIPTGGEVTLDGQILDSGEAIDDGSWRQLTVEISGGVHRLTGTKAFGVWVYGFGNYTSYMYPGGLDLKVINDINY